MKLSKRTGGLVLLWFVLGLLLGGLCVHRGLARSDEVYERLKIFTEVIDLIKKNYVEEVKTKELIEGAIEGMLNSLDPHSAYLTPDMFKELQVETKGSFGGLGIEIGIRDGVLTVISPIEDTPAWRAGIKAGDRIIKINGEPTKGLSLMECVKRLRGPKGTKVTITIMRKEFTEPKDFTIVRDIIKIKSVKYKTLEKGYIYVKILQFQENTSKEFAAAIDKLKEENPEGVKGMVLDLRNNPGGLLDQAVEIADFFLDHGVIVSVKGRKAEKMEFRAKEEGTLPLWPLVVLVNHGSASASEIVAGAIQDYGRGIIVGRKTFGKGSVQTIIPLEDGSGLRLTTARYYTPKGRSIQDHGVEPDIVLKEKKGPRREEKEEKEDIALQKALELLKGMHIFKGYLTSERSFGALPKEEQ